MKIFLSILINGAILYAMTYFLGPNADKSLEAGIILGCGDCSYNSLDALKTYIVGGIILGLMNIIVRPVVKLLSLPLYFVFLGLASFLVNGIILFLFTYIVNVVLIIP